MTVRILFVDDEEPVHSAMRRVFESSGYELSYAVNAEDALVLLKTREYAVMVSDNRMPGMNGVELLKIVKETWPDTIRILMTAFADLATVLQAVNECEVFRVIVKPWDNEQFLASVDEAVHRHWLIRTLRTKDEDHYRSLLQMMELKDPYLRGHSNRVAHLSLLLAHKLGLKTRQIADIRYGALLHDCGKIGAPREALICTMGTALDDETLRKHPLWGADVARQAGLPDGVRNIILHHHEQFDGYGFPTGLSGERIPLEARIVAVANTFDDLCTVKRTAADMDVDEIRSHMKRMSGSILDPLLTKLFTEIIANDGDDFISYARSLL